MVIEWTNKTKTGKLAGSLKLVRVLVKPAGQPVIRMMADLVIQTKVKKVDRAEWYRSSHQSF